MKTWMDDFQYKCIKRWPPEWTYRKIEQSSDLDKEWLRKNAGKQGHDWDYWGARSDPFIGLYTEYFFDNKEQMVLFQLTRCDVDD